MTTKEESLDPTEWRQISGDKDWAKYGCTLARAPVGGLYVELVKITPWVELDSSAIEDYGLYNVQSEDLAVSDLEDVGGSRVKSAIRSAGMSAEEYGELSVMGKAETFAETHGFQHDSSTSSLLDALPMRPDHIHFWAGPETKESVLKAELEMRRECVEHVAKTTGLRNMQMPTRKDLDFVTGGHPFEVALRENDAAGLGYAALFHQPLKKWERQAEAGDVLSFSNVDELLSLIGGLVIAPRGDKLNGSELAKVRKYLGSKETDDEEVREAATELAESSDGLLEEVLACLGFSWHRS